MKLSVLIPAYNERQTIANCLRKVVAALPAVPKEIIVVDDCSRDGTREWLQENLPTGPQSDCAIEIAEGGALRIVAGDAAEVEFRALFHPTNRGKGGALQTALRAATGDVIVIQDADLEYEPGDWAEMLDLIATRQVADVVYGARFLGRPRRALRFHHYFANWLISLLFSVLYNQTFNDVEVCYKMFTRDVLDSLDITANDFGFEIQVSAQIALARRWRIYEVGISYYGRSHQEGKKINWKDGVKALWYLLRYRFA